MATTKERVFEIVADVMGVDSDKLKPETNIVNDLGADSLDCVEMVLELEEEFDIDIPDDAFERTAGTLEVIVADIEKRLAA